MDSVLSYKMFKSLVTNKKQDSDDNGESKQYA